MPAKLDRCVKKIKARQRGKKKKVNPYAVCKAALKKKKKSPGFVEVRRLKKTKSGALVSHITAGEFVRGFKIEGNKILVRKKKRRK